LLDGAGKLRVAVWILSEMREARLNFLLRGAFFLRHRLALFDLLDESWKKAQCTVGEDVHLHRSSRIENFRRDKAAITIGSHVHIRGQIIVMAHGGSIRIGDYCFIGEDARIWSSSTIVIGNRVLISHGVNIHDNIAHSLSARSRHEHIKQIYGVAHPAVLKDVPDAPIVIEDDAWLGFNSTVLKGVTIGKGAVVGAGSIVTKDVEPFSIVVGNPARVIGRAEL